MRDCDNNNGRTADESNTQTSDELSRKTSCLLRSVIIYFRSMSTGEESLRQTYSHVLQDILKCIINKKINVIHFETRPSFASLSACDEEAQYSCLVTMETSKEEDLDSLYSELRSFRFISTINIMSSGQNPQAVWYPKHISDLDNCQHLLLKFEPELQTDHPGFHDPVYKQRRKQIAEIAFNYKYGDLIPEVQYTQEEIETWGAVYTRMKSLHSTKACKEYIEGFQLLEKYCNYNSKLIPQLRTVSEFMHKTSGFRIRPVAGLVTPRDFLASLAFRVFQSTQYIRHHSRPLHTPEPDCIHELIGHIPMLVNRKFADFSQEIGLASLGASEEEVSKLSTLYWFTVEFGLCYENGETRAMGAGIMSSPGELENAFSEDSVKEPLDINKAAVQVYDDVGYQQIYFVTQSVQSMKQALRNYLNTTTKHTVAVYDAVTETVHMKSRYLLRQDMLHHIKDDIEQLHELCNPVKSVATTT
uniref:Biopterin-dependent aromatic amino acid hydroxylase family profile domain-containing protein n=1 Tax=Trichobilharzia regenti TaxID=157069 RepID=A0AA85JW14_TRIRE|nr:unnamed protein product [Trichobilharzia regenti]